MFLSCLIAEIIEIERHLAPHMVEDGPRYENATGIGQAFETGRDVDAVAIEVAALDHHVAEIDPDAQYDLPVLRQAGVGRFHGLLQNDRALDRVDGAGELDQHAIAHHLDDAATMPGNRGLEHFPSPALESGERAGLVQLHEAAVADHIGGQNGGKTALGALFGHVLPFCL